MRLNLIRAATIVYFFLWLLLLVAGVTLAALPSTPAFGGVNSWNSVVLLRAEHFSGSGVYIGNGEILTAAHVAKEADANGKLFVSNADGDKASATVLWFDEATDVGLLKLDDASLSLYAAPMACMKPDASVGDEVQTIGNPLGLLNIHTYGRVASTVRVEYKRSVFFADVTIAPGSSGGPLFNKAGEVVGINSAMPQAFINGLYPSLIPLAVVIPRSVICKQLAVAHEAPVFSTTPETKELTPNDPSRKGGDAGRSRSAPDKGRGGRNQHAGHAPLNITPRRS